MDPAEQPKKIESLAIIWKKERAYKGLASNNYIYKNMLIQGTNSDKDDFKVIALTLDSGNVVWENTNFPPFFSPFFVEYSFQSEDKLVFSGSEFIAAINAENGQTLWVDNLPQGYFNVCVISDYVYKTTQTEERSELYRYNIHTGQKEFLFALTKAEHGDGQYKPVLRMPEKWIDSNGNTLLIMSSRGYSGATSRYRMDIMAWNLTADSMEWYRKGLSDWASSSRPAIEDNRVYFFSISKVFCVDAASGNTIWSFELDPRDNISGFKTANILLVKDKLIAKSDSYWMYGLDKMTGKRLWVNENTAPMPYLLREYKDTIWFSSGGVFAIDAHTGRTLIDGWDKENRSGFWSNPVVHHPTLGYIYTTDGDYIYCLDPTKMK